MTRQPLCGHRVSDSWRMYRDEKTPITHHLLSLQSKKNYVRHSSKVFI
jgi:hypothetical protein